MAKIGLGQSVRRFEDRRLVTGRGQYVADVSLPGQAHAAFVRSPHANARILSVDVEAARAMPGVVAVFTGEDVAAAGFNLPRCVLPRRRPDGSPDYFRPHPSLARDQARVIGDPVAMVVAETAAIAAEAAEQVAVEYDTLASVTTTAEATDPGAAQVWPEIAGNVSNIYQEGDGAAADAAIAGAAHVVRQRFVINRVYAFPMEPRGVVADYDPAEERFTLYTDTQSPHVTRQHNAAILGIAETRLRVVAKDMGGGFGMKNGTFPEVHLNLWAARKLGRPVKWVSDRSEGFQGDFHARDNVTDATLALDAEGRFLALKVETLANVGAYLNTDAGLVPTFMNLGSLACVYRTPAIHAKVTAVFTNTHQTVPYRGAGRPEAVYVIESIIDLAARQLGLDRIELRRKNLIPPDAMPFKTALTFTYDGGEFEKNMDMTLHLADLDAYAERRRRSEARGRLRGLGIINAIERSASGPRSEQVEVRFDPSGAVTVLAGTKNHGQGHETMYRQMLSERLGVDPEEIRVADGDTDLVVTGFGTNGSRSAALGGGALSVAADRLIEKGKRIAAHLVEASADDIVFSGGAFTVAGTDRSVSVQDVARAAFQPGRVGFDIEPGFFASGTFNPQAGTFPNGCHVAEVEIDPDTGAVELVGYWAVDDCGTVVNPLLLEGQMHGGIAQGAGQALMENIVYDPASGQLLSGSLMDYALPRAEDFCDLVLEENAVPTKANPFGIKGVGEAGTVGALAAIMTAVNDALAPLGADYVEMPATAEKVWRAIREARPA